MGGICEGCTHRKPTEKPRNPNLARDHLANERTLLAWTRTALAIIGVGFVVAKAEAGLLSGPSHVAQGSRLAATVLGVVFVVFGGVLLVASGAAYVRTGRQIEQDAYQSSPVLGLLVTAALVVSVILLSAYLLLTV